MGNRNTRSEEVSLLATQEEIEPQEVIPNSEMAKVEMKGNIVTITNGLFILRGNITTKMPEYYYGKMFYYPVKGEMTLSSPISLFFLGSGKVEGTLNAIGAKIFKMEIFVVNGNLQFSIDLHDIDTKYHNFIGQSFLNSIKIVFDIWERYLQQVK